MRKPGESQDEDRSLLHRVARGDQAAFAALYDRYGASSFGMALKICNSRALAEDVVQEAFLSIWQRAGRFDPDRGSVAGMVASSGCSEGRLAASGAGAAESVAALP